MLTKLKKANQTLEPIKVIIGIIIAIMTFVINQTASEQTRAWQQYTATQQTAINNNTQQLVLLTEELIVLNNQLLNLQSISNDLQKLTLNFTADSNKILGTISGLDESLDKTVKAMNSTLIESYKLTQSMQLIQASLLNTSNSLTDLTASILLIEQNISSVASYTLKVDTDLLGVTNAINNTNQQLVTLTGGIRDTQDSLLNVSKEISNLDRSINQTNIGIFEVSSSINATTYTNFETNVLFNLIETGINCNFVTPTAKGFCILKTTTPCMRATLFNQVFVNGVCTHTVDVSFGSVCRSTFSYYVPSFGSYYTYTVTSNVTHLAYNGDLNKNTLACQTLTSNQLNCDSLSTFEISYGNYRTNLGDGILTVICYGLG